MAGPAGRSPEEEALLQTAMRVLPGGVLGGDYAPQELAFVVREARGPRLHDFSGREYTAAQKFYACLVHTDAEVARTLEVFGEALTAMTGTSH